MWWPGSPILLAAVLASGHAPPQAQVEQHRGWLVQDWEGGLCQSSPAKAPLVGDCGNGKLSGLWVGISEPGKNSIAAGTLLRGKTPAWKLVQKLSQQYHRHRDPEPLPQCQTLRILLDLYSFWAPCFVNEWFLYRLNQLEFSFSFLCSFKHANWYPALKVPPGPGNVWRRTFTN